MVSCFMQKETEDDGMMSNGGGRIGDARDLTRSALQSVLRSERDSMFQLEATEMSLQINTTALSDVIESQDALVVELNDRVAVFEEGGFMLREE